MRINRIQNYNIYNKNNQNTYQTTPKINTFNQVNNYSQLPATSQYLAFMGGYSLDLGQTVKQLDKLAQKAEIYPPNLREWLGMILESGNKGKDTLVSAHKKYFESLKDFDTLAQIKARFPEFKDVLSSFDVEVGKGKDSFLSKFQRGELEYFDNDEDLSVQLIKLYWGQGFSLPDLRKYAGTDLFHTMKKLQIPTASRDYGHVLKISDPEYNERLTKEMTEKRLAALDRKAQEQDGEPVFIKRGHLTPEHKQRISEGLKRYYEENPERIYNMSERQKKFYQENPEKAEALTKVLNIAWNVFNAPAIKKTMSKFFQQHGIHNFNPEMNPAEMTKQQSDLMKMFWGQNEWARKSFSKNMKYAWKKVKEEKDYYVELVQIPTSLQRQIRNWAKQKGIEVNDIQFNSRVYKNDPERNEIEQRKFGEPVNRIIRMFEKDFPNNPDDMANTYYRALARFSKSTLEELKPKTIEEFALQAHLRVMQDKLFIRVGKDVISRTFNTDEIHGMYLDTARICMELNLDKYVKTLNKSLDIEYDVVIRKLNPMIEKLGL